MARKNHYPKSVRSGSVEVNVYADKDGAYTVVWHEAGLRKRRSDEDDALRLAKETADRLNAGHIDAVTLTGIDRD